MEQGGKRGNARIHLIKTIHMNNETTIEKGMKAVLFLFFALLLFILMAGAAG
jgi:hypothetical protein